MNIKPKKILFLITLALSFFTLGLVLSNLINEIFPACDFQKEDKYMAIECVAQLVLVYGIISFQLIYIFFINFLLQKY